MKLIGFMHIYNEEYLLPFWLNHHKNIFDHIVIVDYNSTDRSVDICKEIIPDCTVINSRNQFFGAEDASSEIMDLENQYDGFKVCLNVTEYLMSYDNTKIKEMLKPFENSNICFKLNILIPISLNEYEPKNNEELFKSMCNDDVKFCNDLITKIGERSVRYIHNYCNGYYKLGRHETFLPSFDFPELFLITLTWYPMNVSFMKRKLQIKNKMPESDKIRGYGIQHLMTEDEIIGSIPPRYNNGHHLSILDNRLYNYIINHDFIS